MRRPRNVSGHVANSRTPCWRYYQLLTTGPSQNRRVVLSESESESDHDNDSDKSIDDANATKRSSSYLCLNTKSSIDDASKNSLEDDPDDATKNFNSDDVKKGRLRNVSGYMMKSR